MSQQDTVDFTSMKQQLLKRLVTSERELNKQDYQQKYSETIKSLDFSSDNLNHTLRTLNNQKTQNWLRAKKDVKKAISKKVELEEKKRLK